MPTTEYGHRTRVTHSLHQLSLAPGQSPDCCHSEVPMMFQRPAFYALEPASASVSDKFRPAAFDIRVGHEANWPPPDGQHHYCHFQRQRMLSTAVLQVHAREHARQNGYVRQQHGFPGCALGQVRPHQPTAAAFQAAVAGRSTRPGK